jgi:hypothetical protein
VTTLNDLARAGLPLPDGVVLTEEADEALLEASGVLEGLRVVAWREEDPRQRASELRLRYGSTLVVAELNQADLPDANRAWSPGDGLTFRR